MTRLLTFACLSFSAAGVASEIEGNRLIEQCDAKAGRACPSSEQVLLQVAGTRVNKAVVNLSQSVSVARKIGWPSDGPMKAADLWCSINVPSPSWDLKRCPSDGGLKVKVLSYNLYWWNLFGKHDGGGKSAGKLIARTEGDEMYDFMGFQECDSRGRVMAEAQSSGLAGNYETIDGGRAIAMAYLKTRWALLEHGRQDVGEDSKHQYYGKRALVWARFQHLETQKTVFFGSHHGPLPVSASGGCTGSATALNIMKVVAENADVNDAIVITGDFNAAGGSSRVQELEKRLVRAFSGRAIGGIDHVFTNCGEGSSGSILGGGDGHFKSDHDALSVVLRI
jgi:endonuclease/exonuclease/phosphatase family metal-dependent hydrolase